MNFFMKNQFNAWGVKKEQKWIFLQTLILSVLFGTARTLTEISSPILFLKEFSASWLPAGWFLSTVSLPLAGVFFIKVKSELAPLVFFACAQFSYWVLFQFFDIRWVPLTYMVLLAAQDLWLLLLLTNIQVTHFNSRELRHFGGVIRAAQIGSGVIVGILIGLNISKFGITLFPLFNCLNILLVISTYFGIRFCSRDTVVVKAATEELRMHTGHFTYTPYVINLFVLIFLSSFIGYLLKNLFFEIGQRSFTVTKFAEFLSYFNAAFSILSLILSVFFYKQLMLHVRLDKVLLFSPLIVLILMIFAFTFSLFQVAYSTIFIVVCLAQLSYTVILVTIVNQAQLVLLQVFNAKNKQLLINQLETFIKPLSGVIASALLFFINSIFSIPIAFSAFLIAALLLIRSFFIIRMYKEYLPVLKKFLLVPGPSATSFSFDDFFIKQTFNEKLASKDSNEILQVINVLSTTAAGNDVVMENLEQLIEQPEHKVRNAIYDYMRSHPDRRAFPILQKQLSKENLEICPFFLPALYECGEEKSLEILKSNAHSKVCEVQNWAIACLVRYDYFSTSLLAEPYLTFQTLPNKEQKLNFLDIIKKANCAAYEKIFIPLLLDEDPEIRLKAIQLAGKLRYKKAWPHLIANLSLPPFALDASLSLQNGQRLARPDLLEAMQKETYSVAFREKIVLLLACIPDAEFLKLLDPLYPMMDDALRIKILRALALRQSQFVALGDVIRKHILSHELQLFLQLYFALQDFSAESGAKIMFRAISEEIEKSYKKILYILAILYPKDISFKLVGIFFHKREMRAFVIEMLDNILKDEDKSVIIPLLESKNIVSLVKKINNAIPSNLIGQNERLKEILKESPAWRNSWIKACAIYVSLKNNLTEQLPYIRQLSESNESFLKQLSLEAVARLSGRPLDQEEDFSLYAFKYIAMLKKTLLFRDVPEENLFKLVIASQDQYLQSGEKLFAEGDIATSIFLLVKGTLTVFKNDQIINRIARGEVFAELALFYEGGRTATIISEGPSNLLSIPKDSFYDLVYEDSEALFGMIHLLCDKIRGPIDHHEADQERAEFDKPKKKRYVDEEQLKIPIIERVVIMKSTDLFEQIYSDSLVLLAQEVSEVLLYEGEELIREGEFGTALYILCDGLLGVYKKDIKIAEVGNHEIVGEMAALTMDVRSASVAALRDSRLLEIDHANLQWLFDLHPELVKEFIQLLIKKFLKKNDLLYPIK